MRAQDLSGPRVLAVEPVWPDPAGGFIALPAGTPVSPGAPPRTFAYWRGPVPFCELRKVGGAVIIRAYLGDVVPIPFDGVGWQVRAAFDAADVQITNLTPTTVPRPCEILLDLPLGYSPGGLFRSVFPMTAILFNTPRTTVWEGPLDGVMALSIYLWLINGTGATVDAEWSVSPDDGTIVQLGVNRFQPGYAAMANGQRFLITHGEQQRLDGLTGITGSTAVTGAYAQRGRLAFVGGGGAGQVDVRIGFAGRRYDR